MFIILKRAERNDKLPWLYPPFKKMAVVKRLPKEWEELIPSKFGSGIYLINQYGYGIGKFKKYFYGFLERKIKVI